MKKLLTILLMYFFVININAQFEEESAPQVEIFFVTVNLPSTPIAVCTLTAQSQVWDNEISDNYYPGNYSLSSDFDVAIYTPDSNNMGQASSGFDFVTSQQGYPVFAYGLYKVTSNITNKYFYLDYRDQRVGYYSEFSPQFNGNEIDIWIVYDGSSGLFSYSSYSYNTNLVEISNGQLLNIWDLKEKGLQLTNLFPDYWENSLALIHSETNNNPRLVWGPNQESVLPEEYKVYRCLTTGSPTNFTLIETTSDDEFDFVDEEYTIWSSSQNKAYYKILPAAPFESFTYSNTVNTGIAVYKEKSNVEFTDLNFYINQNYPNPFNPTTTITYSILNNENVKITISNILGQELVTLVDENKQAGEHKVEFNASDLPSCVYIYSLITPTVMMNKKMILTK